MNRHVFAALACVVLAAILACKHVPSEGDPSRGGNGEPEDDGWETVESPVDIVKDPLVATILSYMATPRTIAESGASGTNIAYESGEPEGVSRFDVADQRHCWQAIARGIARDETRYIERGLKAIDYAFVHQESGGNFGKSRWFETMGFLEAAARSSALIEASKYEDDYLPDLREHTPGMRAAMEWLVATKDGEYSKEWEQAPEYLNVVAATAVTFHLVGKIAGNPDWISQSKLYIEMILSSQWENGVFPEAGGYDSSYQAVTLWHLMIYLLYCDDEELNGRLREAVERGWEWEKSRITPQGEVITEGNSRTGPQGETWRGKQKQVNYPEVCMSLVYWSHIGGGEAAHDLAEKVLDFALELYRQSRG